MGKKKKKAKDIAWQVVISALETNRVKGGACGNLRGFYFKQGSQGGSF